jgi:arylsulfatase
MQEAGYKTYYTGKLMNGHTIDNYRHKLKKLGLNGHDFMIEPGKSGDLNK